MTLPQSSSQQQSQHFLLKWNNHRSNMVNVFESLLQAENLVDVTIAVEGKFLKAHKIVLSACSPYFESMFVSQTPAEKHPILIFHDMKFAHLKTLLDFMYRGEISIDERDLSDVLKVAEALSIRGLSSFESDDEDSEKSSEPGPSTTNAQSTSNSSTTTNTSGDTNETLPSPPTNSSSKSKSSSTGQTTTTSPPAPSVTPNDTSSSKGSAQSFNNNNAFTSSSTTPGQGDNHTSTSKTTGCDLPSPPPPVKVKKEKKASANGVSHAKSSSKSSAVHENNGTTTTSTETGGSTTVPIKRKRGRQPKNKSVAVLPPPPPPVPVTVKVPSPTDQQFSFPAAKAPLPPRQGVRRRIPRRFSGVASRIKREKLDPGSNETEQEDSEMFDASLLGADLGSEPLSEMSVRGLDLFKYASVEDGVYKCIACEKLRIPKTFKNKYSFQRHAFLYHEGNMRKVFPCPVCSREFSRPDKMKNHLRSVHEASKEPGGSSSNGHSPINDDPNTVLVKATELHETCDF